MRWIHFGVLAVAACGGSEQGVLLVVDAPEGATAQRIEIVLASADDSTISDVAQRVEPAALLMESVRYYRQRAITGEVDGVGALDGFAVRLEPNVGTIPDGSLIPFLIAYDAQNQLAGIGTVLDDAGEPLAVEILPDQLVQFQVAMVPLTQTDGAQGVELNQAMIVDCPSFTRSGIAWQPGDLQLRLLMPDRSQDPTLTDASERELDMDCDGHKAMVDDCDDLRSAFYFGAPESCDGLDTDCDSRPFELVTCDNIVTACGETSGVAVCEEGGNSPSTQTCLASPECACEAGACAECIIPFAGLDGASEVEPCTPAVEVALLVPGCNGACDVEVLHRPGDSYRARIALTDGVFVSKLTGVSSKVALEVRGDDELVPAPASPNGTPHVGGVFLAVTHAGQTTQVSYAIKLGGQRQACPTEVVTMICGSP